MVKVRALALVGLVASLVAGCATAPAVPEGLERIEFQPTPPPFCGACRSMKIVAASDGQVWLEEGWWAGDYRDWRTRRWKAQTTPSAYEAFKARLEPYRQSPEGDLKLPNVCRNLFADQDGVRIRWFADGSEMLRVFDLGCVDDLEWNARLRDAPKLLGVPGV